MTLVTRNSRVKRSVANLSPEHYLQHCGILTRRGKIRKKHSPSTKNNKTGTAGKWKRFCGFLKKDPSPFLKGASREVIMTFLKWMLDNHPGVRKQSSVHQYWRTLKMLAERPFTAAVNLEVTNYINGYLTTTYNLDTSINEKPVMNVDDVYLILYHHWVYDTTPYPDGRQHLQVDFLILISSFTATRPGAIVYVERNHLVRRESKVVEDDEDSEDDDMVNENLSYEEIQTLCYKHITLTLLPNVSGIRDFLTMEIDLRHTKGHHKTPRSKVFLTSEVNDLLFDPVMRMIVMGLMDNAFEANIQDVRQIFSIRVQQPRRSLHLKWKTSVLDVPICRQPVRTSNGLRTSLVEDPKPLAYHTYIYHLQRLGMVTGLMQLITPYFLRRGAGEAVDKTGSQAIVQQVMSHQSADVFQAYLNQRVQFDVQSAFLGRPSADALMKATSHISRYVDPRAPTKLTDDELASLKISPAVVDLRQIRDAYSAEAKLQYGSIKKSEGSEIHQLYKDATNRLHLIKVKLKKEATQESRRNFFNTIETKEVNAQLEALALGADEAETANATRHKVEARTKIAKLLSEPPSENSEAAAFDQRVDAITEMLVLCWAQQAPRQERRTHDRSWGVLNIMASEAHHFPIICNSRQCLFCMGNPNLSYEDRTYEFSCNRKASIHVECQHLRHLGPGALKCPHPECASILSGRVHFKSHSAKEHKSFYFTEEQCAQAGFLTGYGLYVDQ